MELVQAGGSGGASRLDFAGAVLSQKGGALVVRLADGRVIVVPGFFPHEQPPLPADAAPAGAVILPVDAYYAAVAGAPSGGESGSAASILDDIAQIAPGAGPGLAGNGPPGSAASTGAPGSAPGGLRGVTDGVAGGGIAGIQIASLAGSAGEGFGGSLSGGGTTDFTGAAVGGAGNGSTSAISGSGTSGDGGVAGGGTQPGAPGGGGPLPPSTLAGLPLGGAGGGGSVGAVAAATFSAPQVGAVAGSTGGAGGTEDFVFAPANYEISAVAGGFAIRDLATDATLVAAPEFGARVRIGTPPQIATASQVTLADPQDWLFLRTDHDVTSTQLLRHDVGGYEQAFVDFKVERSQRASFGPVGQPLPIVYVDITAPLGAGVSRYALVAGLIGPDVGIVLGDPHDPNLAFAFGAGEVNTTRPLVVFSDANDYDFVGVDGAKFHNLDTFDAANGVATTLSFDRAFLDSMGLLPLAGQAASGGRFIEIRADAADSVVFDDPQNWEIDGITAGGNVQYRALGVATPLLVEMPATLAAKPAYHFSGGGADDTVVLPDAGFGALAGGAGSDTLRLLSGSFDFTALGPGKSVAGFEFIDAGAAASADTIVVDRGFVAADGGNLTLLGGANDRAQIADLSTQWTQLETFTAAPAGATRDFVRFQTRDGSATLNVQAELAQDLPVFRIGGAGNDRLTVEATAKAQTIDGGAGFDLLAPLVDADIDLTALAAGSSVTNIEAIDARGQGSNALTLDDVFVAQSATDRVLSVLGDAADTLALHGGFAKTGSFPVGAGTFDRYQTASSLAATVFVDAQIQVTLAP